MKYMGSKSRIAKHICPIIQSFATDCDSYVEPFVGGANVIDKIKHDRRLGYDSNKYLIALLKRVQENRPILDAVPKELYDSAREQYNTGVGKFEDWELGCIGFLASFSGRFFDGGYAKPGYEKNGHYRDYYAEAKNNLLTQAPALKDIGFKCADYRGLKPQAACIYCDPPMRV